MKTSDIGRDEIFQKSSRRTLFGHTRYEEILDELQVEADDDNLRRYKSYWLRHWTRRNSSRMARRVQNCRPNGRRRLGRTL